MADPAWKVRLRPMIDEAVPQIAYLMEGALLEKLLARECITSDQYDDLCSCHFQKREKDTARKLIRLLQTKPFPSFENFCKSLLEVEGGVELGKRLMGNENTSQSIETTDRPPDSPSWPWRRAQSWLRRKNVSDSNAGKERANKVLQQINEDNSGWNFVRDTLLYLAIIFSLIFAYLIFIFNFLGVGETTKRRSRRG